MPRARQVLTRIATAAVALPVVLLLVWHPALQIPFALFVGMLAAVGLFEYYAIVRARQISPETIGGILAGTVVALSGYFSDPVVTNLMLYGGCLLVAALHIVRGQHSVAGLSSSVFGVFYVGWFTAHILLLQRTPEVGPAMVTLLFVVVVLTDTMAFTVGSLIGRHKLAPKVSPNKTWEGSIGGTAGALVGVAFMYELHRRMGWQSLPDWSLGQYLAAGFVLSVVAQIGDLTESVLKRDAGVKDSGAFFPGHGGVLDRCDSFLFACPVLYYIYVPYFA